MWLKQIEDKFSLHGRSTHMVARTDFFNASCAHRGIQLACNGHRTVAFVLTLFTFYDSRVNNFRIALVEEDEEPDHLAQSFGRTTIPRVPLVWQCVFGIEKATSVLGRCPPML